jgi:hypothetical protein
VTLVDSAAPAAEGQAPPPAARTAVEPPRLRHWWRRPAVLGGLGAVGLLVLVVLLTLLATGSSRGGDLDPRSAQPSGTLALAELLRHRGIDSSRSGDAPAGGTLVVPFAGNLDRDAVTRLLDRSGAAARIVLLVPSDGVPGTDLTEGRLEGLVTRPPNCSLPAATTAGTAHLGGRTFTGGSTSCYGGSLVLASRGSMQIVVLGSAGLLTNDELADDGNAALAQSLLSGEGLPGPRSASVVWYQPSLDPQASPPGLRDLLPPSVKWATLQLAIAVGVLALWRGRRLGPVVEEPLPVVVPAAETVEGRARLYAAGRARGAAADALRAGARARLGNALEHGREPDPTGLVTAVAARAGRQPGEVALLLYGSAGPPPAPGTGAGALPPADDGELVRLADDIDRLEREVHAR